MNPIQDDSDSIVLNIISSIINRRNTPNSRQIPPSYALPSSSLPSYAVEVPYYVRRYYSTNMIDGFNAINEALLSRSLDAIKPTYKKVLSEDGEKQLQKFVYDPEKHNQNTCPILQTEFEKDEEITMLPCKHYFNTGAIEQWLKEEKAECPICRHCLKHIEVKDEEQEQDEGQEQEQEQEQGERQEQDEERNTLINTRINLYNSLARLSHPFGPRFDIYYEDTNDLTQAIVASLTES